MFLVRLLAIFVPFVFLLGCETGPSPIVIHQDRWNSIRILYDPTADPPHSHPYPLTPAQLALVMKGVWVKERNSILGFGLFEEEEGQPAFTNQDISLLATSISRALRKASPKDLVSFYLIRNGGRRGRLITSGGVYIQQNHLIFILANFRNSATDTSDINVSATELDNREYPLESLGRYSFSVGFSPSEAWLQRQDSSRGYDVGSYGDPAKQVVIDLNRLFDKNTPRKP